MALDRHRQQTLVLQDKLDSLRELPYFSTRYKNKTNTMKQTILDRQLSGWDSTHFVEKPIYMPFELTEQFRALPRNQQN